MLSVHLTATAASDASGYPILPVRMPYAKQPAFANSDPLLLSFLQTDDEEESQHYLALITNTYARPIVKNIVGCKLGVFLDLHGSTYRHQDAEDLYNEVLLHVITRLRHLKAHKGTTITRFQDYVAVVAYHACHRYWNSQKHPQRKHIEGRLRNLLNRDKELALWHCMGREWLCGFAVWRQKGVTYILTEQYRQLLSAPRDFIKDTHAAIGFTFELNVELLTEIFTKVGVPLRVHDLAQIVADLYRAPHRVAYVKIEERAFEEHGITLRSKTDLAATIEERSYLRYIWKEICDLPLSQRTVLLLNLKDPHGTNLMALLPMTGIATVSEIAVLLSISIEEFADLWMKMPLDDEMIAQRLSLTRQQVINQRKAARRRLLRRIRKNLCKNK